MCEDETPCKVQILIAQHTHTRTLSLPPSLLSLPLSPSLPPSPLSSPPPPLSLSKNMVAKEAEPNSPVF